mmetsp:Transcript_40308/g.82545  ORF Transcript_40308/g.82545 Transcript_40308/m.82545 type:complete len:80 (+) Transcript_40308:51-290(+)
MSWDHLQLLKQSNSISGAGLITQHSQAGCRQGKKRGMSRVSFKHGNIQQSGGGRAGRQRLQSSDLNCHNPITRHLSSSE